MEEVTTLLNKSCSCASSSLVEEQQCPLRTTSRDLPTELVLEILSRLPLLDLEYITRLKLLSKSFLDLIEDPSSLLGQRVMSLLAEPGILILSHDNVTGYTTFYYVKDEHNAKPIYRAPFHSQSPTGYQVESYCNGLVCFCRYDPLEHHVFVCNPITREHVALPSIVCNYGTDRHMMRWVPVWALGCSRRSSKEYKVLRVHNLLEHPPAICTLGSSSWREVSSFPPHVFYGKTVFAHGAMHWKVDPFYSPANVPEARIVSFDVDKEEFYITKHPEELGALMKNNSIVLTQLGGSLAAADLSSRTHIDIWVLQDNIIIDKQYWVKECVLKFVIPECLQVNYKSMCIFDVIGLWQQGDILIASNKKRCPHRFYDEISWNDYLFYSHDGKTEHVREVHNIIQGSPSTTITRVCGYSRSLLSLKPYGGTKL